MKVQCLIKYYKYLRYKNRTAYLNVYIVKIQHLVT